MCGWIGNGSLAASPVRAIVFRNPAVVAGPPRSVMKTYRDSGFSRRNTWIFCSDGLVISGVMVKAGMRPVRAVSGCRSSTDGSIAGQRTHRYQWRARLPRRSSGPTARASAELGVRFKRRLGGWRPQALWHRSRVGRWPLRRPRRHPCFAKRLGGVSAGNETQGWRDSSHTAMVGAGKFESAKLPMATATYPGKPSPSQ
jgi:hypothetical protein